MSYGSLAFDAKTSTWQISNLAPHVAIVFKRLFQKVPVHAIDIEIADNDDARADLHWFLQRYPLDHSEGARLQEGVDRQAAASAVRKEILLPDWNPGPVTGFRPNKKPYGYQRQAAALTIRNPSLLLGDDLGLGKTISAITTMIDGAPLPAAIVVQPHLARQWYDRIREFTELRVYEVKGREPYDLPPADAYIFRYSNVAGWTDVIKTGLFKTVIYDEIQELRTGPETSKGAAARILSSLAEVRLGLTATPVYNYGDEMFAVMEFIQEGLLGTREEFMREWCSWSKQVTDPVALGGYLRDRGYFLRRTEHDEIVGASLPPLNVIEQEVDWSDDDADDHETITRALALKVLEGEFVERGQAARQLDLYMRQLTGIAKARNVAAYVDLLLKTEDRVLLAGWHRDVYRVWMKALEKHQPKLYTGSETQVGKRKTVSAFTEGDSRVMIISLRSGAGLDGLQHFCADVVFGEFDWSPQVHKQVIGRLRRPGQTRQVTAHYIHTAGGSDPLMIDILGVKASQSQGINDPDLPIEPKQRDDAKIRRLAQSVLGLEPTLDER